MRNLYLYLYLNVELTTLKIDEEIVSIFRSRDQRPSQQSLALSQIAFEHFQIVFDKSNNLHSEIQFVKQHAHEM